jgi:hypothetical protein
VSVKGFPIGAGVTGVGLAATGSDDVSIDILDGAGDISILGVDGIPIDISCLGGSTGGITGFMDGVVGSTGAADTDDAISVLGVAGGCVVVCATAVVLTPTDVFIESVFVVCSVLVSAGGVVVSVDNPSAVSNSD